MTDQGYPKKGKTGEPHPSSSHRSPGQIAKEARGPGGPAAERGANAAPKKAHSREEEHVRSAVQRSAHPDRISHGQHSEDATSEPRVPSRRSEPPKPGRGG